MLGCACRILLDVRYSEPLLVRAYRRSATARVHALTARSASVSAPDLSCCAREVRLMPASTPQVLRDIPGIAHGEVSAELGRRWRAADAATKQVYGERAVQDARRATAELRMYRAYLVHQGLHVCPVRGEHREWVWY